MGKIKVPKAKTPTISIDKQSNKRKVFDDNGDGDGIVDDVDIIETSKKHNEYEYYEEEKRKKLQKKSKKMYSEEHEGKYNNTIGADADDYDDDSPEQVTNHANEVKQMQEWYNSLIQKQDNAKDKKKKAGGSGGSKKKNADDELDISILDALDALDEDIDSNDHEEDEDEEDDEEEEEDDNRYSNYKNAQVKLKISKNTRNVLSNMQVSVLDATVNDPFSMFAKSNASSAFQSQMAAAQNRIKYTLFKRQKKAGPAAVFKR